jgi:hypothetical protein
MVKLPSYIWVSTALKKTFHEHGKTPLPDYYGSSPLPNQVPCPMYHPLSDKCPFITPRHDVCNNIRKCLFLYMADPRE